jgi:hypothetical protein
LPADLPVYALQDASGLSAEDSFTEPTTLVELAKAYVGEILQYVVYVKVCNVFVGNNLKDRIDCVDIVLAVSLYTRSQNN